MSPFERLAAWREAHTLTLAVYKQTDAYPRHERFGIVAQARRAAVSVPANIAEGCVKRGAAEFRRYLDIARGSLAELQYLLLLSRDLEYLTAEQWKALDSQQRRAGYLTWRLYESAGKRKTQTAKG